MDIINYLEVDNLEEHLKNRAIQEALLRPDSIEWALNYDKENLGKNLAIAYGLDVTEWEQYKNLDDFEKIDSSVSGNASVFIILARIDLRFAELFYDKILPYAKVKKLSTSSQNVTLKYETGTHIMLKYQLTGDRNTSVSFTTRIEGLHDNITNILHDNITAKSINKFKDLSLYRGSGCRCNYSYTVWYI